MPAGCSVRAGDGDPGGGGGRRAAAPTDGEHGRRPLSVGAIPTVAPYLLPARSSGLPALPAGRADRARGCDQQPDRGGRARASWTWPWRRCRWTTRGCTPSRCSSEPLLLAACRRRTRWREAGHDRCATWRRAFILLSEMHCLGEQVLSLCRAARLPADDCLPQCPDRHGSGADCPGPGGVVAAGDGPPCRPQRAAGVPGPGRRGGAADDRGGAAPASVP